MVATGFIRNNRTRSDAFFKLGTHFGIGGFLVLAASLYLIPVLSLQAAGDLLAWCVSTGMGFGFVAVLSFVLAATTRPADSSRKALASLPLFRSKKLLVKPGRKQKPMPKVEWNLGFLQSLDWKVFRDLGIAYFEAIEFRVMNNDGNRTTGIDFWLYREIKDDHMTAVRCLPWGTDRVDLQQVRDFHRAASISQAAQGVMLTTGVFSDEAMAFAEENALELIGGEDFAARLSALPWECSQSLQTEAARAERIREEGKVEPRKRKKTTKEEPKRRWF